MTRRPVPPAATLARRRDAAPVVTTQTCAPVAPSTVAPAPVAAGEPPVVEGLPTPPGPHERYLYLGPQGRAYPLVQGVVSVVIGLGIAAFFARHAQTVAFVVPTLLTVLGAGIAAWTTRGRRRVTLDGHRELVTSWRPDAVPSVDVFLPTAGEPLDLLRNTYEHVSRLRWPGRLAVLVLDDGARGEVEALAREFGFTYLTRPDRGRMKKAGNLAFGYERSDGDAILVLDADFCPAPDSLRELVPYLDDPRVGIVQSPQYFDAHSPRTWLERAAGATQELFYRWVQPARDAVGAAICVGTNAVYRRSALQAAGGFAQIGHSEDVHTGVALLKKGFELRYVPVLVARGLCPDGVTGFLNQQYRWCSGSMSLLADRTFHNAGLSTAVRLCFWSGFLYYVTTAVNVFSGFASAVVMLWLLPQYVSPIHYLPVALGAWAMFFQWRRVSLARHDLGVVRVRLLYSVAHAFGVWHALTGRTEDWVPTGAAGSGTPLARRVCRTAVVWFTLVELAVWGGVVRGLLGPEPGRFWLSTALAVLGTVVVWPVIALAWPGTGWRSPRPLAAAGRLLHGGLRRPVVALAARDAVRRARRHGLPDVVTWPEALAAAAVFGLVLLVSSGVVDALLPVVGP